jgi:phosphate/sulfate permease
MMFPTKRFLSWIDIAPHEVPRVFVLFLVTLSFMTAHVIGHAYTLAAVTESFGSESLPFFFIVQAVVAMCGTLVFGRFVSTGNHSSLFLLQSCLA